MAEFELYIDGRMCDLTDNFSVRLNRQLINPGELSAKDAQYSYSVTLPITSANNEIFGFANIEETRGKFVRMYIAELIAGGVRIFMGNFRLSEISERAYKGNLVIPAPKTVKDVFNGITWKDLTGHWLPFDSLATSVSRYNRAAATEPQKAIFPYVLYGVLPKRAINGIYSDRNVWDDSTIFSIDNMPPSVNVLMLLREAFSKKGFQLNGNVFSDLRLRELYLSHKDDGKQGLPWNYRSNGRIKVEGTWQNAVPTNCVAKDSHCEKAARISRHEPNLNVFEVMSGSNSIISHKEDPGGNLIPTHYENGRPGNAGARIVVPISGYYKIEFAASLAILYRGAGSCVMKDQDTGVTYEEAITSTLKKKQIEIRLTRTPDADLSSEKLDGTFCRDNLPQSPEDDERYYPRVTDGKSVHLIDAAQDKNIITGFSFGVGDPFGENADRSNPMDSRDIPSQTQIASPFLSWDVDAAGSDRPLVIVPSPGYMRVNSEGIGLETDKYKVALVNTPVSYDLVSGDRTARGKVCAIAWLNRGEVLSIISVSYPAIYSINYSLELTPFRSDKDWIPGYYREQGKLPTLDWNDSPTFESDRIDLFKFMPQEDKVDDWITEFCKAFNLRLSQTGNDTFSLDTKPTRKSYDGSYVDLDGVTSVRDRVNTPLGLPSLYKLGFTVDMEEEGYFLTNDDGGGEYSTGATEEKIIEQKSKFSYNWFKDIIWKGDIGSVTLPLPIISKHDVWVNEMPYSEAQGKSYTDLAPRFWLYGGLLNDLGASFTFNGDSVAVAKVTNSNDLITLDYKGGKLSILDRFFTLLITGSSHYTKVEGYLSPAQYEALNGTTYAMFNGDLYYIAELSGYDPSGRNKTEIKLIRKI
jgi:hypothetical protein